MIGILNAHRMNNKSKTTHTPPQHEGALGGIGSFCRRGAFLASCTHPSPRGRAPNGEEDHPRVCPPRTTTVRARQQTNDDNNRTRNKSANHRYTKPHQTKPNQTGNKAKRCTGHPPTRTCVGGGVGAPHRRRRRPPQTFERSAAQLLIPVHGHARHTHQTHANNQSVQGRARGINHRQTSTETQPQEQFGEFYVVTHRGRWPYRTHRPRGCQWRPGGVTCNGPQTNTHTTHTTHEDTDTKQRETKYATSHCHVRLSTSRRRSVSRCVVRGSVRRGRRRRCTRTTTTGRPNRRRSRVMRRRRRLVAATGAAVMMRVVRRRRLVVRTATATAATPAVVVAAGSRRVAVVCVVVAGAVRV